MAVGAPYMRIVVTGGFGFIGSHLSRYLLSQGHSLCILAQHAPDHLSELRSKVEFNAVDIARPIDIILPQQYDILIHLAAANDIDSKDAERALKVNALGTKHVLDFCRKNNINKIVYLSTFQVYGVDSGSVDENSPINCKNDYAMTHFFAEEYIKMYSRLYDVNYFIVRPTNVYGCPVVKEIDRWSLVPGSLCLSARKEEIITLLSSGKQHRDFVSLQDVSMATEQLLTQFGSGQHEVVNLASGQSIAILDTANIVKEVYEERFGKSCAVEVHSTLPLDAKNLIVDTSKLRKYGINITFSKNKIKKEVEKIFDLLT